MLPDKIFHSAFDASPIGQCLLARAEVQGRPLFDAFPTDPDNAAGTGMQDLRASIAAAIATRQSQTMEAQRYPIQMHADGRSWFEDRYWSATNTPVYADDGTLLCISHTTIDITARVRSRVLLHESESRLSAYVSATSDVLYRMSPD